MLDLCACVWIVCVCPCFKALHQFYAFAVLQNRALEFDSHSYILACHRKLFLPAALCLKHFLLLISPSPNTSPLQCLQNLLALLFLHYYFDKLTQSIIMPELSSAIVFRQIFNLPFSFPADICFGVQLSITVFHHVFLSIEKK